MAEFSLSTVAYCKMVLHSLKYPHSAVMGLFIGEKQQRSSSATVSWRIVDVVPLLHQCRSLIVSVEAALCQVDAQCHSSNPSKLIVGLYFVNESLRNSSPDTFSTRVAEKLQSHFSDAVLMTIDNRLLGEDSYTPCHQPYHYNQEGKTWKRASKDSVPLENEEEALSTASGCIQAKLHRELIDFDNHLDNPSLDYWNLQLNAKIDDVFV